MPASEMKKEKKPQLYFKHKDILNQIQLEKPSFSLYLHENMLDFYNDIGDVADCLEVYSLTDQTEGKVQYSYDQSMYINEFTDQNAVLNSMAITECNNHVMAPAQRHMFQMQKP